MYEIQQLDENFVTGEYEMQIDITYNSVTKTYPFNVTFLPNAKPVFGSEETSIKINTGDSINVTLSSATDAESDTIYYFLDTNHSVSFTYSNTDSVTYSAPTFEFRNVNSSHSGNYTFAQLACSKNDQSYCTSYNFDLIVNSYPSLNISISSEEVGTYTVGQTITRDTP